MVCNRRATQRDGMHRRSNATVFTDPGTKFAPALLANDEGIRKISALVRSHFTRDGHHVQFNVVTVENLRRAQAEPQAHRDLIVRVAGYSDYFCDLSREL